MIHRYTAEAPRELQRPDHPRSECTLAWCGLHPEDTGSISDGYHTFDELYRHRALLTAALFDTWAEIWSPSTYGVHKSRLHSDGTKIDGYFIVMALLPTGQISYHYPDADWDLFDIPELDRTLVWDGHTSADVLDRLESFLLGLYS